MNSIETPRVPALTNDAAPAKSQTMLEQVTKQLGKAPNLFRTMAHSPATLEMYLKVGEVLGAGLFSGAEQEVIALAVGQENNCQYCLAAHTMIGKMQGLSEQETLQARQGGLENEKLAKLAEFSQAIVRERGFVSDEAVQGFLDAGWEQAHLVELIAQVSRNLFTNYFNHVMRTEVDFPTAPSL